MTILVTNDDGYKSAGINVLYRAAKKVFGSDVVVVAPDKLQSSSGMSFTFHKPLRVEKLEYEDMPCISVSGTPADCVFMALNHLFKDKITMVLSGINTGMNAGLMAVYSSGTVSAAIFSSISNIPSVAFSKCFLHYVDESGAEAKEAMESLHSRLVSILTKIKEHGFPSEIEMLNVNFPVNVKPNTPIKVVKTDRKVFEDIVKENKDPHGKEYYWLYSTLKKDLEKDGDVRALLDGSITITPIVLSVHDSEKITNIRSMFYDAKN